DDAHRAQQDHEDHAETLRTQPADEPLRGGAERHRLLDRHAGAAERSTSGATAGRRPRGLRGAAHAASSALSWLSTISRYSGEESSSSAWVPRPTTAPSSSTTIW